MCSQVDTQYSKKYKCKHFDSNGRPINKGCKQRTDCRFIHPNDQNWPAPHRSKAPVKRNAAEHDAGKHGKALPSQSDLFLRAKTRGSTKIRNYPGSSLTLEESRSCDAAVTSREMQGRSETPSDKSSVDTQRTILGHLESSKVQVPSVLSEATIFPNVNCIGLNLEKSSLTLANEQDKRLRSYSKIAANLCRVSPRTGELLANSLAKAMDQHRQYSDHATLEITTMISIWRQILEKMGTKSSQEVTTKLLKEFPDNVLEKIIPKHSEGGMKRKRQIEGSAEYCFGATDTKRLRVTQKEKGKDPLFEVVRNSEDRDDLLRVDVTV